MSRKLAEFKAELILTGLAPGFPPIDVPLWEDARNVLFSPSGIYSAKGMSPVEFATGFFDAHPGSFDAATGLFDAAGGGSTPMSIGESSKITGVYQQVISTGSLRVCAGTLNKLFIYEGGSTVAAKTGLLGFADAQIAKPPTYWSFTNFGNWLMATNGLDVPQIYKAGPTFVALGGVTFTTAEIFRKLGPHILAFNTSNGTNIVERSAEGEPEQWDPFTYPTAGRLPLQDLENAIVAVEPLGQSGLAVYTKNEVQLVQYIGGAYITGARAVGQGFGAASKNAIVPVGALHYGIEQNGVFATDGTQFIAKSFPALGKWLDRVNWAQRGKIAGWHSRANGCVHWALPIDGNSEPNIVLTYDYRTERFGFSDMMFTVGLEAAVFDYPIVGRFSGKVDFAEKTLDDRGAPVTKWTRTKPLDGGDPQIFKYLDAVLASIKVTAGVGPLLYTRGLQELSVNSLATTPWEGPFPPENNNTRYSPRVEAPYLQLEFRSTVLGEDWQISSFTLYGEPGGSDW